jgi:hypothetical protein
MELIKLFLEILDKPHIKRPYNLLQQYYENNQNEPLSEAFKLLIEDKFNDNNKSIDV